MAFVSLAPGQMPGNPFEMIGKEWMLIAAGDRTGCNAMTAAWGALGEIWNKPVSFLFVRPQRYTYQLLERCGGYSLCFFGEENRPMMQYMGTASGRSEDKIAGAGLTLAFEDGVPYFEQARLVLICRKLYRQDLEEGCFVDRQTLDQSYPLRDFHRMHVGEVTRVLLRR